MHNLLFLFFLVGLAYSNNLFAQNKFEKESRIEQIDVPSKALFFVDSFNYDAKIKWYKEEGLTQKSIEAKFKHNKTKYSIEFDTLGNIEDVEIEVHWEDIETTTANLITKQLNEDCSKHKIQKTQRQFTGTENDLFSLFRNGESSEQLKIKYEVVVRCNKQKEVNLFEYLFNEKGILERKSKLVFQNSSHLEY